jgi:hypothetical protein
MVSKNRGLLFLSAVSRNGTHLDEKTGETLEDLGQAPPPQILGLTVPLSLAEAGHGTLLGGANHGLAGLVTNYHEGKKLLKMAKVDDSSLHCEVHQMLQMRKIPIHRCIGDSRLLPQLEILIHVTWLDIFKRLFPKHRV